MPFLPGGGKIEVVIGGAQLVNRSGIGLNAAKLLAAPAGWNECDGYKEHFRPDDTASVRYFRGPWGTRKAFYDWCLGESYVVAGPGGGGEGGLAFGPQGNLNLPQGGIVNTIGGGKIVNDGAVFLTRVPPAQHPEYPWMYAVDVELVRGEGAAVLNPNVFLTDNFGDVVQPPVPVPMIGYVDSGTGRDDDSTLVAVTYRNLDYEIRTDAEMLAIADTKLELERHVTRSKKFAIQGLPIQGELLKFTEGAYAGDAIAENARQVILSTQELVYVWRDVPDVPEEAIALCEGRINQAAFDGARAGYSWPAEELLMQSTEVKRMRSPTGRVTHEIAYHFLRRPVTWNKFPAKDGRFYRAAFPDGTTAYSTADFSLLFRPPSPFSYQ